MGPKPFLLTTFPGDCYDSTELACRGGRYFDDCGIDQAL